MVGSANTVRLGDCGTAHCITQTVSLTNFTPQGVSDWDLAPSLGVALNRFAEDAGAWLARFLPARERPVVATVIEEPKAPKKAPVVYGDSSLASYVRGLRGLHSYEYEPVEVKLIDAEALVIPRE